MAFTHPHPTPAGIVERPQSPLNLAPRYRKLQPTWVEHVPEGSAFNPLQVSAGRYPHKTAVQFYNASYTYAQLLQDAERLAGYLQQHCGVERGDRVLVFSQNCPQFIAAYFAILRADAVFVPANAMLLQDELEHIVSDSGAVAAFVAQELVGQVAPLLGRTSLRRVIVHAYGDALEEGDDGLKIPEWLRQSAEPVQFAGGTAWAEALAAGCRPSAHLSGPDDLCMLPYTSGTTGKPKACVHTHRSVTTAFVGTGLWRLTHASSVYLSVAPLFHLLGLQTNANAPIFYGGTIVLMARWDRETAAELIERHGVTYWAALPAMLVDFFAQPGIEERNLSSLGTLGGGGAAMPMNLINLLKDRYSLDYIEGYGLTETAAFLCLNPYFKPKRGCLGIPGFGVDMRVVDPETFEEMSQGEVGEIVVHGAQVMLGYWNNPKANTESFVAIDGKRFFRTGDLASVDEEGYFFIRDRLKRMINAAGFKVWPAEVEAILGTHPSILEACVIASPDEHRGETVKALVTLRSGHGETHETLLAWCRENMATYKAPRICLIVDSLPKNATGKINWRELQEQERAVQA
ncbi:long-chain-fatty-acid--CoA ligase [Pseudomonas sp. CAN2814]|uniref:long-chain-fatty-acid--CoA ligase n=1 Tax=Pseudomonas sp. CAN1 TaxID=3046726 RepID=UPI00264888FA|nr:long-chain-fatty-acid--CoA ligase [Pseudomonas sp. CAN1]MDN6860145.1 long-chain-fatty-acid--CoA ligase [Pseudomonas sp. CAN1]